MRVAVRTPCRHISIMYSPWVRADSAQVSRDGTHGGKGAGVNGSHDAGRHVVLADLVAELGALVRKFEDLGIRLYGADEVEEREFAAYAVGWRDALATLPPQARRSELTLLDGGLVIPFPRTSPEEGPAGGGETVPSPTDPGQVTERAPEAGFPAAPADPQRSDPEPDPGSGPDSDPHPDPAPRFVEKNARSKTPTVPRIEREKSRRKDRRDFFDH